MRDNGPTVVLLAALLAFFGIRNYSPEDAAALKNDPKGSQLGTSSPGEKERNEDGVVPYPTEETLGPSWPSIDFKNTGNVNDTEAQCPDVEGWQTRYLIACVPDPQDSSSGYRFDYLIDAIQRAAETQHFVLDRYFYPWSPKKPAFDIQGTLTKKGSDKREIQLAALSKPSKGKGRTDPNQWPGVLLFRESPLGSYASCCPQLLQVFLVGETATAGIHKRAFTTSLDMIGQSNEYKENHTVRILGPYFSGSQTSLERTLQAWTEAASQKKMESPKQFTIISGEATAIKKERLEASCPNVQVKFQATFIPEDEVLKTTLRYLRVVDDSDGRLKFKDRVAFLAESNTTFGKSKSLDLLKGKAKKIEASDDKSKEYEPAYFPFPLHISEVRSAYQQTSGLTKNDIQNLPSFGSKLRLPLASSQPRDVEPLQDHAMTAVAIERILGNMLNTIAGERVPYTIILASDVKDKLFLVTLLRQRCPETRLILSGNDLLFSHPDFSAALRGTIVGSTYPLYLRNQHWSLPAIDADHRHILFPSEEAQGYYNAAVASLNPDDSKSLLEYSPPFPALRTGRGDSCRPPVWVSIIGQGGPVPLTAIPMDPNDASAKYVRERKSEAGEWPYRPLRSSLWTVLVLGITLLFIYVFYSYFAALWRRDQWWESLAGREMQKLFLPHRDAPDADGFRRRQRLYTFACLTSVLILYAYLTFICLIPFYYWCGYGKTAVEMGTWSWIAPIILVPLLLLIAATFAVPRVIPPSLWTSTQIPRLVLISLLPLITLMSMVLAIGGPPLWAPLWGWLPIRILLYLLILIFLVLLIIELFFALRPQTAQTENPRNERSRLFLLGAFINLVLMSVLTYYVAFPERSAERLLFFERATNLTDGVSPVVPVFFLAMAFFCWGFVQLKRLSLLASRHTVDNPFPEKTYFEHVQGCHGRLKDYLSSPGRVLGKGKTGAWIALVALLFTFLRLYSCFVRSVEGILADCLIFLGFAVLAFVIVYGWLHLCKVWRSIRELMDALALLPRSKSLGEALKRIPPTITRLFGPYLSTRRAGLDEQSQARQDRLEQLKPDLERVKDHLMKSQDPAAAKLLQAIKDTVPVIPEPKPENFCPAAQACFALLGQVWSEPTLVEKFTESSTPASAEAAPSASPSLVHVTKTKPPETTPFLTEDITTKDDDKPARNWLMRVQDFVALEVTVYLSQFFVHLRNLILFLAIAPILMLLAVSSYPFQPQRLWLMLAATLIIVVTATIIWIVIQIERNEVVSHILSTTPNRLNFHWHFLGQVLIYAAPLLGVVIATSSLASDLIHALVDPLIQALR